MAFLFYINDQLTDQPNNDMELITAIRRDSTLGALLVTQEVALTWSPNASLEPFTVSGYTILKNLFDQGLCNEADLLVVDKISPTVTYEIYRGVFKVPEMEVNEQLPTISCKIRDNSFYSYISTNKNIKFNLRSTNTKSKQLIDPVPIYEVDMFNPSTGVYGAGTGNLFRGYRVYDVFRFLVGALSDNKVGFESAYLQQVTIWEQKELFVFDGLALVDENTDPTMSLSFQDLFNEVFKARNVSFFIDMADPANPVLRLENIAYFFNQSTVYSFADIKELITTYKVTKLYGTINIGSEYTVSGSYPIPYSFPEGISYFGFKKETYTPLGQCNTDQELDLVNKFIISSNAIGDQLVGVIDKNLDETFLIECENVDTTLQEALASRYPSYSGVINEYFYNLGLTNAKRLPVHGSNFQSALTNTLTINGNGFRASLGSDFLLGIMITPSSSVNFPGFTFNFSTNDVETIPVEYVDEFGGNNYDGNNNYTNVGPNVGQYEVPADGNYSFATQSKLEIQNLISCADARVNVTTQILNGPPIYNNYRTTVYYGIALRVTLEAYTDNTLITLVDSQSTFFQTLLNGQFTVNSNFTSQLQAGNVVVVKMQTWVYRAIYGLMLNTNTGLTFNYNGNVALSWDVQNCGYQTSAGKPSIYLLEDSYFECNGTPDGEIVVASNDPDLYKVLQHQFTYDIPVSDFQNILANPIGLFPFEKDGVTRNGWIEEMIHNNFTGRTQVKLITSDATIPQ